MTPQYILKADLASDGDRVRDLSKENERRWAEGEIDNMTWAEGYAEPGYKETPKKGVLFANWNYFSARAFELLEKYGFACEWSDEWTTCDNCNKAVRTNPDSHGWKRAYWITEDGGEITCEKCTLEYEPWTRDYLETLENHYKRALTLDIDPTKFGYTLLQEAETGIRESAHYNAEEIDPKTLYKKYRAQGWDKIIFKLDSSDQFDIQYQVYGKKDEDEDDED